MPEKKIKEILNGVGYIAKFETILKGEQRSRIVDSSRRGMLLDHRKLLSEWVQESDAISVELKNLVVKLGKNIIGEADA